MKTRPLAHRDKNRWMTYCLVESLKGEKKIHSTLIKVSCHCFILYPESTGISGFCDVTEADYRAGDYSPPGCRSAATAF